MLGYCWYIVNDINQCNFFRTLDKGHIGPLDSPLDHKNEDKVKRRTMKTKSGRSSPFKWMSLNMDFILFSILVQAYMLKWNRRQNPQDLPGDKRRSVWWLPCRCNPLCRGKKTFLITGLLWGEPLIVGDYFETPWHSCDATVDVASLRPQSEHILNPTSDL